MDVVQHCNSFLNVMHVYLFIVIVMFIDLTKNTLKKFKLKKEFFETLVIEIFLQNMFVNYFLYMIFFTNYIPIFSLELIILNANERIFIAINQIQGLILSYPACNHQK